MSTLQYEHLREADRKELLMRVLGVSDEDISRLDRREVTLPDIMQARIYKVIGDESDTSQCAIVCRNIKASGCSWEELHPEEYLEHINELKAHGGHFADEAPASPVSSGVFYTPSYAPAVDPAPASAFIYPRPFVRYFARIFDLAVYLLISNLIFYLAFKVSPTASTTLVTGWSYCAYVLMFSLEPLLLHAFGTTPGKMIFGIKVLAGDGSKLSIRDAYIRSLRLLRFGFGFVIPIWNIVCLARSFASCKRMDVLEWDAGTRIERQKSIGAVRTVSFIAILFAVSFLQYYSELCFELPPNRGAITEEQFYENCSHIVRYRGIKFNTLPPPSYDVRCKNGEVVSVTLTVEATGSTELLYDYYEVLVAYLAFAGAQKDIGVLELNNSEASQRLSMVTSDYSLDFYGLTVSNEAEVFQSLFGDRNSDAVIARSPDDDDRIIYRHTFKIEKNNY